MVPQKERRDLKEQLGMRTPRWGRGVTEGDLGVSEWMSLWWAGPAETGSTTNMDFLAAGLGVLWVLTAEAVYKEPCIR